ncbi:MAG TPA: FAD-binding oxidoreductase [Acidobacteriaceae bacterium]
MSDLSAIAALLADPSRFITTPAVVGRLSKDFYWYSPVLRPLLENKQADAVAQPVDADEIVRILSHCYAHNIPVTPRGAGTGNYGQAIPLNRGLVLDLSRMDRILSIDPGGVAECEPGVRLAVLEAEAALQGWELRCYPSTIAKATLGGFLGGGSGGIGSVAHGALRDFGTVRALEFVTMEATPRVLQVERDDVHQILHAWGTNGVISRIWLALTPRVEWSQCAAAFPTFAAAFNFCEAIASGAAWTKRLVTAFEWPIPSYFSPIAPLVRDRQALAFFLMATPECEAWRAACVAAGGDVTFAASYAGPRTTPLLSDYTWNHTTLWAIKHDARFTYLQCGFDPDRAREQMRLLKEHFADEILFHMEWMKNAAERVTPGAIPLVRFTTVERLQQIIDLCREIGVFVANPHVNNVEDGGRFREDNVQLLAKHRYDPKGLLNPGKMLSFQPRAEPGTAVPAS